MDESDRDLARSLAREAGEALISLRSEAAARGWAIDELRTRGDTRSNEFLIERLAESRPDDGVLSEEAVDNTDRLTRRRVWIIDPLDGTREFGELDRSDWAVHVALVVDGHVTIGAVAIPALGEVFDGSCPARAVDDRRPPRIVVSRTRPPSEAELVASVLGGVLVPMGSAGAKTAAIIRGEAELYIHAGGQYEWDLAAPAAIAVGAGLHASRLDGSALEFNRRDPYLPDALIGHTDLASRALAALGIGKQR